MPQSPRRFQNDLKCVEWDTPHHTHAHPEPQGATGIVNDNASVPV